MLCRADASWCCSQAKPAEVKLGWPGIVKTSKTSNCAVDRQHRLSGLLRLARRERTHAHAHRHGCVVVNTFDYKVFFSPSLSFRSCCRAVVTMGTRRMSTVFAGVFAEASSLQTTSDRKPSLKPRLSESKAAQNRCAACLARDPCSGLSLSLSTPPCVGRLKLRWGGQADQLAQHLQHVRPGRRRRH